ncbi:MAG: hypothetical protein LDLANPLL_02154 [Turneriella sp.]|nr:hypothetical protein [Turneriella sp.]
MERIRVKFLFITAGSIQVIFLVLHLSYLPSAKASPLFIETLPIIYLAATYFTWLSVATFISFKTKIYRVPLLMHVPHLFSFLPLLRHIILAANKENVNLADLTFAYVHACVTHTFSLVAAWMWQMRDKDASRLRELWQKNYLSFLLFVLAQLAIVLLYAGGDFGFKTTTEPWAVGFLQALLNSIVIVFFLYKDSGALRPLPLSAAILFSLTNVALLFDTSTNTLLTTQAALAASGITQLFSLFVFLLFEENFLKNHLTKSG